MTHGLMVISHSIVEERGEIDVTMVQELIDEDLKWWNMLPKHWDYYSYPVDIYVLSISSQCMGFGPTKNSETQGTICYQSNEGDFYLDC